jgi:Ca2+-binding EF-hand superfamily protein
MAVPKAELEVKTKECELALLRADEADGSTIKALKKVSELEKKVRENAEAQANYASAEEARDQIEEELEIVTKRLENWDAIFKWENQIFAKIAGILKRAKVAPLQAFEHFDVNGDGRLSKKEFDECLAQMKLTDLTSKECDILWDSLDTDKNGAVEYKEFCRKLERYGVRNRTKEEIIIYQIIEAVNRSKVQSMGDLFELIDRDGRGIISREDFKDIFENLGLKLDKHELEKFVDNFWRDKEVGIDYQGFLRIFSKYQIRLKREQKVKRHDKGVPISAATIKLKKNIFDDVHKVLTA